MIGIKIKIKPMIVYEIGKKTMTVDGKSVEIEAGPVIVEDTIMVPINSLVETVGGNVSEYPEQQAVIVSYMDVTIMMRIGTPMMTVNDVTGDIAVAPNIIDESTMIPLRDVAESLGLRVEEVDSKIIVFKMLTMLAESIDKIGYDVPVNSDLTVTFNHPPELESLSNIQVTVDGGEGMPIGSAPKTVSGTWSVDGASATFTPSASLEPMKLYEVFIQRDVKSVDGTAVGVENEKVFTFLTSEPLNYEVEKTTFDSIAAPNGTTLPMSIVVPKTGEPVPVMFWVHGGGWQGGTPDLAVLDPADQEEYLSRHLGIAVVSVSYRCLGSDGTFDQGLEDVMTAVEYTRGLASTYNLDMSRIGFYGGSAGTPLASTAAQTIPGTKVFVGYSGIYNFEDNPGSVFPMTDDLYGIQNPSRQANSPIFNLGETIPKTLLLHGTADNIINHQQSVLYAKAINDAGGEATAVIYQDMNHGFSDSPATGMAALYYVKEFLKNNLIQ